MFDRTGFTLNDSFFRFTVLNRTIDAPKRMFQICCRFGDKPVQNTHREHQSPPTQLLEEVRAQSPPRWNNLPTPGGHALQTVRRDVQRLAESGLLAPFMAACACQLHGGEPGTHPARKPARRRRARIARAVAEQVPNDCSLILNIGTTTEAIAKALLHHRGLRVITNNLNVARHP